MGRLLIAAITLLAIPIFAAGQRRGGAAPEAGHAAAVAPRAPSAPIRSAPRSPASTQTAVRAGTPVTRGHNGVRTTHHTNGGFFNSGQTDFQGVPGLGFDFPHLAAINGNRRHHGHRFDSGVPFGFSGFLLTPPVIVEEVQSTEPPQDALDEESAAENAGPVRPRPRSSQMAAEPEPAGPPAPQRDVEEYVFVRRDGGLLFAVAYAWENSTLRYVTPDGLRRSIAKDALDLSATQQFNEQRGLSFRSPA
jgi:hypothetical protein